jgi:hypothetical protein
MQVKEKGECFQSNNFLQIGKRGRLNHLDKSKGSRKKKYFLQATLFLSLFLANKIWAADWKDSSNKINKK